MKRVSIDLRGDGVGEMGENYGSVAQQLSKPNSFQLHSRRRTHLIVVVAVCDSSVFLLSGYWSAVCFAVFPVLSIPVTVRRGCALYASIWSLGNAAVAAVRLHPAPRNRHRWLCSRRTCFAASVQQASRIWRRFAVSRRRRSNKNSSACVASVASSVAIRRW